MSDVEEEFFDSEWGYNYSSAGLYTPPKEDDKEAEAKAIEELELKKAQEKIDKEKRKQDRVLYENKLLIAVSKTPEPQMTEYEIMILFPKEYQKYKNNQK